MSLRSFQDVRKLKAGIAPHVHPSFGLVKRIIASALTLIVTLVGCLTENKTAFGKNLSCAAASDLPETRLLIFGELHGTQEMQALVAEKACALVATGKSTVIGLEIETYMQPLLDTYLFSSGSNLDKQALLAAPFWQGRDGRSSQAMFALIERARQIKSSGGHIRLLAFSQAEDGNNKRDALMAENIRRAFQADADSDFLILVGNAHAIKVKGSPFDPTFESTAYFLSDLHPTTILIAYRSGTAWNCKDNSCGVSDVPSMQWTVGKATGFHRNVSLLPGFDGTYLLEKITGSPPASFSGQ